MARKKKVIERKDAEVPLSAMIDIVFLLIIFFVVTASVDKEVEDESVNLAYAPHGKPIVKKDPRSVIINVHKDGEIVVGLDQRLPIDALSKVLTTAVGKWGNDMPIVVRGDAKVQHYYINKVQDAVTNTGLYKIRFMAIQSE